MLNSLLPFDIIFVHGHWCWMFNLTFGRYKMIMFSKCPVPAHYSRLLCVRSEGNSSDGDAVFAMMSRNINVRNVFVVCHWCTSRMFNSTTPFDIVFVNGHWCISRYYINYVRPNVPFLRIILVWQQLRPGWHTVPYDIAFTFLRHMRWPSRLACSRF